MSTQRLNILYVTPHFPFPLIGGERIKQYQLLRHLSKKHNIILISMNRMYPITDEYIHEIEKFGVEVHTYNIKHLKSMITGAFFTLFRHPLEIEYFRHNEMKKKIDEVLKNNKIDFIINYFLRTAEFVRNYDIPKVLISDDCRTMYQENTHPGSTSLYQKILRRREVSKLRKYESEITNDFNCTTFVSQPDLEYMQRLNPGAKLDILSIGVDTELFSPPPDNSKRKNLLFTGKLDVWLNRMMAKDILENIFPAISNEFPDIKLIIAGANPGPDILKYRSENIEIYPNPHNIAQYYQNAELFLHPQYGGSGLHNKLLEAMSCGCPSITTQNGIAGLYLSTEEKETIVAADLQDFIQRSISILKSNEIKSRLSLLHREYILKFHQWDSICYKMDEIIDYCLSKESSNGSYISS